MVNSLIVGDIIQLRTNMGKTKEATIGLVIKTHQGAQMNYTIIFKDGAIYSFIDDDALPNYLIKIGHTKRIEDYKYQDADKAKEDFYKGVFDCILKLQPF